MMPELEIDLKSLVLYTNLPELWEIFNNVISIGTLTESGFSLLGMKDYLEGRDGLINITHKEFWKAMKYFLSRLNSEFLKKLEVNRQRRLKSG